MRILQLIGLTSKTHSVLRPLVNRGLKRKGHLLKNPTKKQVQSVWKAKLRQARMNLWKIINNESRYDYYNHCEEDGLKSWAKRPLNIIDKIIVSATNKTSWDAGDLYDLHISPKNPVTPGKPLPGAAYHFFVNDRGTIEQISDVANITTHTATMNTRSIGVVIQYLVSGNTREPIVTLESTLQRLLVILCMQYKLNPYKAIRGQREISLARFLTFIKGDRSCTDAPGHLVLLDTLRRRVAIEIQQKLKYAKLYDGQIKGKFNRETRKALNEFSSDSLSMIYESSNPVIIDDDELE